ncbi:helix-turn-helix domain-containing protein [Saccharothrix sp. ST-888]|uniref:helix-turn-helix domain-containing protein n=1 Tax=Saccharothrix sp. ST-888 TaxID=1427391 RepID=UPI0005EBF764|nr:helix-turn-helix domain-containing protein [Saccharothrix sp. ST-888]KJK56130.1 hypothetical protein UK12_24635 [Saccharothrix sp. ST-888]
MDIQLVDSSYSARKVEGLRDLDRGVWNTKLRNQLAITAGGWADDRARCDKWVDSLVHHGASGVAVVCANHTAPLALAAAAGARQLPILTVSPRVSWTELADLIHREQLDRLREEVAWHDELLEHISPRTGVDHTARLVRRLARQIDGHVLLVDSQGRPTVTAPEYDRGHVARCVLTQARSAIHSIATGALASGRLDVGNLEVRLAAVGTQLPRSVLVTARVAPHEPSLVHALAHATELLALRQYLQETHRAEQRQRRTASALRSAVFQLLVSGEIAKAQRVAGALYPSVLRVDQVRVYILQVRPAERNDVADKCSAALGEEALAVRCPINEEHVIVVAPQGATDSPDSAGTLLGTMVAEMNDWSLGASDIVALEWVSQGYRNALRALASARQNPARAATYQGHQCLVPTLDGRAEHWALSLLAPVLKQDRAERDALLETLRLYLEVPIRGVAQLMGVHRNTVTARLRSLSQLLRMDLEDVRARAALSLALELMPSGVAPAPSLPLEGERLHLADLLATAEVRQWARSLLAPVPDELMTTLQAWVMCNAHTQRTSKQLGRHPQTVRAHLRAVLPILQRDLVSHSGDRHLVVLAVAVLHGFAIPEPRALTDEVPRQRTSSLHVRGYEGTVTALCA